MTLRYQLDPAEMFTDLVGDPDPWQRQALRSYAAGTKRMLWLASRQAGKSSVASIIALWTALFKPGSLVLMVSPSLPQSQELFRKAVAGYRDLGQPVGVEAASALRLEMGNGSRIVALPGSSTTNVGYTSDLVLLDEAVRTSPELVEAVLPTVAVSGGSVVALSSAGPAVGWFHSLWTSEDTGLWERFEATADDVPRLSEDIIQEAILTRGPRYADREFFNQWSADDDAFLPPNLVDSIFDNFDKEVA